MSKLSHLKELLFYQMGIKGVGNIKKKILLIPHCFRPLPMQFAVFESHFISIPVHKYFQFRPV